MRYIKIPEIMSGATWIIGDSIPKNYELLCDSYIDIDGSFLKEYGQVEYIIDVRVFKSKIIYELLTKI